MELITVEMCVNSECVAKEAYKDEYPDPETQLQWQEVKFITLDFSEVSQAKETSWNPVGPDPRGHKLSWCIK